MKNYLYLLLVIPMLILFNCDTTKVKPKPKAAFSADKTVIDIGETVYFYDESENNPTIWAWDFGDGSAYSTSQNPSHTYTEAGTYSVTLGIANANGDDDYLTKTNYITVNERLTDVTFFNPAYTQIDITVQGVNKTIAASGSATFYDLVGTSTTIDASTSGKTSGGTQVGLKLYWTNTIDLPGGTDSHNLDVGSDYFFVYVRNNGTHVLTPLYVNYGLNSQTYDNIMVPADNVKYSIGYYKAWSNSNARMYYQDTPSSYVYWNQGTHFTLPFTINQQTELYNSNKSDVASSAPINIVPGAEILMPAPENLIFIAVQNSKANHLFCKEADE